MIAAVLQGRIHKGMRRILCLGGALLLLSISVGDAAAVPDGPRLALVKWSLKPFRVELLTVDPSGSQPQKIVAGGRRGHSLPMPLEAPTWSPDGNLIAYSGVAGSFLGGPARTRIFIAAPDGSGIRPVPGTRGAFGPVFAPDGRTIAFSRVRQAGRLRMPARGDSSRSSAIAERPAMAARTSSPYRSTAVWMTDLASGVSRRLTPWRDGLEIVPTSFSPDGAVLLVTRKTGRQADPEIVALHMDGSAASVLASKATDGVYSPDGTRIAFARLQRTVSKDSAGGKVTGTLTDLFVIGADGSESWRLTDSPASFEIWPSWDPSGERLAYTRLNIRSEAGFLGFGDAVMEVNADGSCSTKILSRPWSAFYGPTWQPGAGREAGRIAC